MQQKLRGIGFVPSAVPSKVANDTGTLLAICPSSKAHTETVPNSS